MQREEIDIQLWEYVDSTCSPQHRERIAALIAEDEEWNIAYQDILAFNNSLSEQLQPDETSANFVENTMKAVSASKPAKAYINTWVTKGIAAFFILTIGSLLVYSLTQVSWSSGETTSDTVSLFDDIATPQIELLWQPSSALISTMGFVVMILILALVDKLIKLNRLKAMS